MKILLAAAALAAAVAAPASATLPLTLTTTNGGDGFVTPGTAPAYFTLFGANNDVGESLTSYQGIAASSFVRSFRWTYVTNDLDGSGFDPAGFIVNGVLTQLSANGQPNGSSQAGVVTLNVGSGQSWGFYVNSVDSILGRGQLTIGAVPEPESWVLLIAGFGMVGAAMRRRAVVAA